MSTSNWFDMMVTEEGSLLDMSLEEWTAVRAELIKTRPAFAQRIDATRRALWYAKKDRRTVTPDVPQLRYYRDVADEPWKYGDDAFEQWQLLDRDLPLFPGRWRVEAYWTRRLEEEVLAPQRVRFMNMLQQAQADFVAKNSLATKLQALVRGYRVRKALNEAATKIQALVRGHQLRCSVRYMDCAECLAHGATYCEVEGRHLCRTCFDKLGWVECGFCGMPLHVDRVEQFHGCCSAECWAEIQEVEPEDEYRPCGGCGDDVPAEDYGEYGLPGYWCSRACAYDLHSRY